MVKVHLSMWKSRSMLQHDMSNVSQRVGPHKALLGIWYILVINSLQKLINLTCCFYANGSLFSLCIVKTALPQGMPHCCLSRVLGCRL